jgi:hypothetical protein
MKIGRGTNVLRQNLPQHHFVHHKSHMTRKYFVFSILYAVLQSTPIALTGDVPAQ